MSERRWSVSIEVCAEAQDAARLRKLLPALLHGEGYTTTTGTRTVEVSFLEATEGLHHQPEVVVGGPPSMLPVGKRHKRMGHGPSR
jgi:hypothetical protein